MRMAEEMRPGCTVMMKHIIGTVASKHIPSVWAALPQHVQDEVVAKAVEDTPGFVAAFFGDLQAHLDEMFDLKEMVRVVWWLPTEPLSAHTLPSPGRDALLQTQRAAERGVPAVWPKGAQVHRTQRRLLRILVWTGPSGGVVLRSRMVRYRATPVVLLHVADDASTGGSCRWLASWLATSPISWP